VGCAVLDAPPDTWFSESVSNGSAPVASEESSTSSQPSPSLSRLELLAGWNALRGDAYELDSVERWLEEGQKPTCDRSAMVSYPGTTLRYYGALLVSPPFKQRLERFEEIVVEVSREIYGRAPRRIRHYGSFNCRPTRNRSWVVSEHALGNAVDLVGFDFAPATRDSPIPRGSPPALGRSFQVRVAKHWNAETGLGATHARFLTRLTDQLRERPDIFRSMFGPGHGGHDDHLHLDAAPYRYVDL
jgi:hypothetical protein